ncbi:MAG: hypothetical protein KA519_09285, partial [Bacteroides sp.]|uniref:hypothetical protein n=1 Tax=Bacteroides sp. TaxID=29523 RepID=UPI001B3E9D48
DESSRDDLTTVKALTYSELFWHPPLCRLKWSLSQCLLLELHLNRMGSCRHQLLNPDHSSDPLLQKFELNEF